MKLKYLLLISIIYLIQNDEVKSSTINTLDHESLNILRFLTSKDPKLNLNLPNITKLYEDESIDQMIDDVIALNPQLQKQKKRQSKIFLFSFLVAFFYIFLCLFWCGLVFL